MSLEASTFLAENYLLPPEGHTFWDIDTGDVIWMGNCKPHPKVSGWWHREAEVLWHRICGVITSGKWGVNILSCSPFGTACFHRPYLVDGYVHP